jgi:hypothetical protein
MVEAKNPEMFEIEQEDDSFFEAMRAKMPKRS